MSGSKDGGKTLFRQCESTELCQHKRTFKWHKATEAQHYNTKHREVTKVNSVVAKHKLVLVDQFSIETYK